MVLFCFVLAPVDFAVLLKPRFRILTYSLFRSENMLVRMKLKLYLVNILSDIKSSDDIFFFHNFLELSYV